MLLRFIEN